MYVRQVKQFVRNVDSSFDERRFGFGSLVDLLRACQREGLFRIERDRQGVMRVFPGNVMQPVEAERESVEDQPAAASESVAEVSSEPENVAADEPAAAPEIVDGAVVQEIESTPPVMDAEEAVAPQPQDSQKKPRGRTRRGSRKPPEGAAPRARKTAKPRTSRGPRTRKEPAVKEPA
jgi:hypothetical protein